MIWALFLALACRSQERAEPKRADEPRTGRGAADRVVGDGSGRRAPDEVPRDKPETVVFIVMDTTRADHLSLCGYERPTSPFLEHLRDHFGAAVSCHAYSPATWTMPSHTSYFTGRAVPEHGHDLLGRTLPDATGPMLAETFHDRGYTSVMFAANCALAKSGLQRGFDVVRIGKDMTELRHPDLEGELKKTLTQTDATRPLFLFVNLIDAHDPYPKVPDGVDWVPGQPSLRLDVKEEAVDSDYVRFFRGQMSPEQRERFLRTIRDGYDYGLWMEDANIQSVMQVLRDSGRLPGPLRLVITADHGEYLGEHDLIRHPTYVYEPGVRVPFVYYDNLATAPITLPEPMSALSAYHLLKDGHMPEPALPVTSWSRVMNDRAIKPGEDMIGRWSAGQPKLLWWNGKMMTFDLAKDPGELAPGDAMTHPLRGELEAAGATYRAYLDGSANPTMDPEAVQQLKDIGYMH